MSSQLGYLTSGTPVQTSPKRSFPQCLRKKKKTTLGQSIKTNSNNIPSRSRQWKTLDDYLMLRGEEFQLIRGFPTLASLLEPHNIQKNQLYSGYTIINRHNRAIDRRDQLLQLNEVFILTLPGAQYHQTFLKFNGKILSKDNCRIILQLKYWKHCLKRLGKKSKNIMKVLSAIQSANQVNSSIINEVRTRNIENIGIDQLLQKNVPVLHKVAEVVLESSTQGVTDLKNQKLLRETQIVLLEFHVHANSIQIMYRRQCPRFDTPSAAVDYMKIIGQLQNLGNNTTGSIRSLS
ncbi:MAG: hypothetical protein EZS28_032216 [Streblomastix strix]|uniref:Uncharacterized protein n=1 Tax=Streblomastix strix TaxID=222440 RepID=A0A5J4UPA0_9EUKA|nr:MAG: hypothetical protein EZS28_032216 [Streblomastix strix]